MIHGLLNIYKPRGATSYDVIRSIKRMLPTKTKIGHTGTLDPLAEGVLPICIGEATKLVPYLINDDKVYRATILLGIETDTFDSEGKIMNTSSIEGITELEIREVVNRFIGEQLQIPPMFSAIKKGGVPLYKLARQGKVIEREGRPVTIYSIEIESINLPRVVLKVHCSKGTYIRSLAHDMGKALGISASLAALVRLKSGGFSIDDSIRCEKFTHDDFEKSLISLSNALQQFPTIIVSEKEEVNIRKSGSLPQNLQEQGSNERVKIVNQKDELICIAIREHNRFRTERIFNIF